ncbi:MAG: L-histidine N(alpha)-methyltransferase [Bryobacteraceae bacterium]
MSTLASAWSKTEVLPASEVREFATDVRAGFLKSGEKELHSKYLYDELGSALFEAITLLPEYGLTRADARLLENHADEIASALDIPIAVAELGSGTGQKTRYLLEALWKRQAGIRYYPIDVSSAALGHCARELESVAQVFPIAGSYLRGLAAAVARRRSPERLLVLFLGSTIGNFEPEPAQAFLRELRDLLWPGDGLLLGTDLVKSIDQLLLAYDDPAGVTAAFNLNLLARINRELGANFVLRNFQHQATYNTREDRIEMRLLSRVDQVVTIPGADCELELRAGETIWTESSHKFRLHQVHQMAADAGFRAEAKWVDQEWPFAESLWIAI